MLVSENILYFLEKKQEACQANVTIQIDAITNDGIILEWCVKTQGATHKQSTKVRLCDDFSEICLLSCVRVCIFITGNVSLFLPLFRYWSTPKVKFKVNVIGADDAEAGEAVIALEQLCVVAEMG